MSGAAGPGLLSQQLSRASFGELLVSQPIGEIFGQWVYNINPELFTDGSTGSGSIAAIDSLCVISSGAASSSVGKITSIPVVEYQPGTGVFCRISPLYGTPAVGNTQLVGVGDDTNGFFVGFNGTTFSVLRRSGGVDDFTAQQDFSIDKLDGTGASGMTLDPSKGNVFQCEYQWLGFGSISFSIENPLTGILFKFHRIDYANQNTVPSVLNPSLPFQAECINTTNTTDVVLKLGSVGVYTEGFVTSAMHLVHAAISVKTTVTTRIAVITMRNNAIYGGVDNFVRVQPKIISIGVEGNKTVSSFVIKNTTLGGTPNFVDFNTASSPVSIDKDGTTVTGGVGITGISLDKDGSGIITISDDTPILLGQGETLTVTAETTGTAEVGVVLTWEERFK